MRSLCAVAVVAGGLCDATHVPLSPSHMRYCNNGMDTGRLPALSAADAAAGITPAAAAAWVRHGARALSFGSVACWVGDHTEYRCGGRGQTYGWADGTPVSRLRVRSAASGPGMTNLPGDCQLGELAEDGIRMMRASGAHMRDALVGSGVLPPSLTQEAADRLVYARATRDTARCPLSAVGFLEGLYPAAALADDVVLAMDTPDPDKDTMLVTGGQCPRYNREFAGLLRSATWQSRRRTVVEPLQRRVTAALGRVPGSHMAVDAVCTDGTPCGLYALGDCIFSHLCETVPAEPKGVPPALSQRYGNGTLAEAVVAEAQYELYAPSSTDRALRLAVGRHLGEVVDGVDAALSGTGPVFRLYAAHDTTPTVQLLQALGIADGTWPPFAAQTTLLLYRSTGGAYVRAVVNGESRRLPMCVDRGPSGELCDWRSVRRRLASLRMSAADCDDGSVTAVVVKAAAVPAPSVFLLVVTALASAAVLVSRRRAAPRHVYDRLP